MLNKDVQYMQFFQSFIEYPKLDRLRTANKKLSCRRDRVTEYFAKSLKVTQGHSKWHC